MKKMSLSVCFLVLVMLLSACGNSEKAPETTVPSVTAATLEQEPELGLADCTLSTTTWSSPNGATVHLQATPLSYTAGDHADLLVRLESDEVATVSCDWNGSNYAASVDLNAEDGLCYYLYMTAANGNTLEVPVNTPSVPRDPALINMKSALESYCSITIEGSEFTDNTLVISAGRIQVQVPTITNNGETIAPLDAALTLTFEGNILTEESVTLAPSGTDGLFDADISSISFAVPGLEDDQQLELSVQTTLSNGQILSAYGGNWICNAEDLLPVVG